MSQKAPSYEQNGYGDQQQPWNPNGHLNAQMQGMNLQQQPAQQTFTPAPYHQQPQSFPTQPQTPYAPPGFQRPGQQMPSQSLPTSQYIPAAAPPQQYGMQQQQPPQQYNPPASAYHLPGQQVQQAPSYGQPMPLPSSSSQIVPNKYSAGLPGQAPLGYDQSEAYAQTPNMRAAMPLPSSSQQSNTNNFNKPPQQEAEPRRTPSRAAERIDPSQIPRPLERKKGEPLPKYFTRSGLSPPGAQTEYETVDEGNCSPRFMRMTCNQLGNHADLMEKTKLCIGAIIQPLASPGLHEPRVDIVNDPHGPFRCARCKAYVNPSFKFVENGTKYVCNICHTTQDVPEYYYCNVDANGIRRDKFQRPELCKGSVEWVASPEYVLRPIQDPAFLFVIDVSYHSVVTGLLHSALDGIRNALDTIAANPKLRAGIITYDDTVHFYSLKPPRVEPQMFVVSDVNDVFLPIPAKEIVVRLSDPENRMLFEALLDLIPNVFTVENVQAKAVEAEAAAMKSKQPYEPKVAFGAAAAGAAKALSTMGGKVLLVQGSLPNWGAGALKMRDDKSLYNTKNEKTLFVPQNYYYHDMSIQAAQKAITFDLYVCANSYVDLATVGVVCTSTGGQIFLYPSFNARKDGMALSEDISHNITRETGYDGVMIVRCSAGMTVTEHYGNYFHQNPNEIDLPTVDQDKTFGIRVEHDDKIQEGTEASIQCALLYTSSTGQRLIRVHTLSLPVSSAISNIFRHSDLDAIINLSLKQGVRQLQTNSITVKEARNAIVEACIDSLFTYRKYCASSTSAGQLILPEPLKLLPMSTLGLIKNPLFADTLSVDERSFLYSYVTAMPCDVSVTFITPRLFALHEMKNFVCIPDPDEEGRVYLPPQLQLSHVSVDTKGVYLLDDARFMYLFAGAQVDESMMLEIFGTTEVNGSDDLLLLQDEDADPRARSSRVKCLISTLRKHKSYFQNLQVISRQQTAQSTSGINADMFFNHLIEDGETLPAAASSSKLLDKEPKGMSYVDFLCYIHKKIQGKFY